ncbi:MAG: tRNA 4-thiouridine(8) synthase ThiI [Clostridiales bacterium]|jgi:thiamine biosynthesis protein ThiI|nr:tRNA 4-thiouridine(8) synthase ThiI [Clostridiales bacterium]
MDFTKGELVQDFDAKRKKNEIELDDTQRCIVLRYAELHLKGKNKSFFEKKLISNIKLALANYECKLLVSRGRYEIVDFNIEDERLILYELSFIFGLHSFSVASCCKSNLNDICKTALGMYNNKNGTFKLKTNRADKSYPLSSYEISSSVGNHILQNASGSKVDLHYPKTVLNVDVRENGKVFVFTETINGAGGMPYGTAGKGLLLLSGGIDSPVAGIQVAKRGLELFAVHFWSYPYTSESAKQKVLSLVKIMSNYCPKMQLCVVSFTEIQEAIRDFCEDSYMITIIRRCMMMIAQKLAVKFGAQCIVTGESLGQVASQTLESINVTNNSIQDIPVLRPLIGYDKEEIISLAKKIGTYNTSILPYEDCCNVFHPKNPVTKPTRERAMLNQNKIPNLQQLIENAVNNAESI